MQNTGLEQLPVALNRFGQSLMRMTFDFKENEGTPKDLSYPQMLARRVKGDGTSFRPVIERYGESR